MHPSGSSGKKRHNSLRGSAIVRISSRHTNSFEWRIFDGAFGGAAAIHYEYQSTTQLL